MKLVETLAREVMLVVLQPMMLRRSATLSLRCSFANNRGHGALQIRGGEVSVSGSRFVDNAAAGSGGALAALGGEVTIADSHFSRNAAERGGALHVEGDATRLAVAGSVLAQNAAEVAGGAAQIVGGLSHIAGDRKDVLAATVLTA